MMISRRRSVDWHQANNSFTGLPPSTILIGRPIGLMFSLLGVDAQALAEGLEQIVDGDRAVFDFLAAGVGFADHLAAADAAAGQRDVERPG